MRLMRRRQPFGDGLMPGAVFQSQPLIGKAGALAYDIGPDSSA